MGLALQLLGLELVMALVVQQLVMERAQELVRVLVLQ